MNIASQENIDAALLRVSELFEEKDKEIASAYAQIDKLKAALAQREEVVSVAVEEDLLAFLENVERIWDDRDETNNCYSCGASCKSSEPLVHAEGCFLVPFMRFLQKRKAAREGT